jgi:hypothetical protein
MINLSQLTSNPELKNLNQLLQFLKSPTVDGDSDKYKIEFGEVQMTIIVSGEQWYSFNIEKGGNYQSLLKLLNQYEPELFEQTFSIFIEKNNLENMLDEPNKSNKLKI